MNYNLAYEASLYEDNYYMTNTSPTSHCFDTLKFMEIP